MSAGETYDVAVVGAGLAGSAAACRAAQLGLRVVLIDAADDPTAGGNTAMSGGGLHIGPRLDPIQESPAAIRDAIVARTAGEARPEVVDALASNAGRALRWLIEQGVELAPPDPSYSYPRLAPARYLDDVHAWRDKGPQRALAVLHNRLAAGGGRVLAGTCVAELDRNSDGSIGGVITQDGSRLGSRIVILADGGFQADSSLRTRHIGPAADRLFLRAASSGKGDALRMGEEVGAKLAMTSWFYGHCLHRDAFKNDRLWPWPGLDEVMADGGILVDVSGRRVIDESIGGIAVANVVAHSDEPFAWVVISDELWREAYGREVSGHLAANPELEQRGGRVMHAVSASDLASTIQVDVAGLVETIDDYSRATQSGQGATLPVPRSGVARPFIGDLVAFPMVPGITYTTGGLLIDSEAAVLDVDGHAIPGLYAAGAAAASVYGGPNAGYIGGLMTALITGLLAGEAAREQRRSR